MNAPTATESADPRARLSSASGVFGLALCAVLAGVAAFALTLRLARHGNAGLQFAPDGQALAWMAGAGLIVGLAGIVVYVRRRARAVRAAPQAKAAAQAGGRQHTAGRGEPAAAVVTASSAAATIPDLAASLLSLSPGRGGFRTLVAAAAEIADCNREAIGLAAALTAAGKQVMIVDWRPDAAGVAAALEQGGSAGLTELLHGDATFTDVVRRARGASAHIIPPGRYPAGLDMELLDPDRVNLILDALDQAYDHILVVGSHVDAKKLFERLQGRFDAGILVAGPATNAAPVPPGNFLGFGVAGTGIAILNYRRPQ